MKVNQTTIQEVNFGIINKIPTHALVQNAMVNQHPLFYSAGRVFIFEGFAQTDWQHKQVSEGKHWFYSLNYSEESFEEFQSSFKEEETGSVIPVVNLEHNHFWQQIFMEITKDAA